MKSGGGRCGKVCWGMEEVRRDVEGMGSSSHIFPHLFLHLPLPPPHFSPPQHISPLLPPFFSLLPYSPILHLIPLTTKNSPIPPSSIFLQTPPKSLYSSILPHTPYLPLFPIATSSFTFYQNFSFIAKLVQQSSALETS